MAGWIGSRPTWIGALAMIPVVLVLAVLAYIALAPCFRPGRQWEDAVVTDAQRIVDAIAPVRITHIGAALQHAEGDGLILAAALTEARSHQARITLLHVMDAPGTLVLGRESWSLHGTEDQTVPYWTIEQFVEEMQQAGNRC